MPMGEAPSPHAAGSHGLAPALPTRGIYPGLGVADGKNTFSSCRNHLAGKKSFQLLGSAKERMRPRPQMPFSRRKFGEGQKKKTNQQPLIAFFNKRKKFGLKVGKSCLSISM